MGASKPTSNEEWGRNLHAPFGFAAARGRSQRRRGARVRLGAWLLSKGKITEDQLQKALQHHEFFGGRIGSSLITLGYVDEDVLGAYLSDVSGTPYAPASRLEGVAPEVIALVPARLAAQYRVVPIGLDGRRLRLAMRDPRDLIALDEIAFMTGMTIEPFVATDFRVQKALTRYYQVAAATPTVPLAGPSTGTTQPNPPVRPPAPLGAPMARSPELGFDGYPLDADPDPLAASHPVAKPGVPAAAGVADGPPPSSLQQWRMAQEEIPDEFPDPPARSGGRGGAPALAAVPRPAPTAEIDHLLVAAARLQRSESRNDVFEAILDYTATRFLHCALFIVQSDRMVGWGGRGPGIDQARVREVIVSIDRPSLFSFLRTGADHFYGPVSELPANTRFFLDMGIPPPERTLLMPLSIKDRPTVMLYCDTAVDAAAAADRTHIQRLLAKASLALEILILRNKIGTL